MSRIPRPSYRPVPEPPFAPIRSATSSSGGLAEKSSTPQALRLRANGAGSFRMTALVAHFIVEAEEVENRGVRPGRSGLSGNYSQ